MANNTTIDGRIRVCTQISLRAECPEDISEERIDWKVKIDNDDFRLEELKTKKILLGENIKVSGKDISFVVPKEWGQKTVTIIAYLQVDETQLVNETYLVLDHIVAAFYRIDTQKPTTFTVEDIRSSDITKHFLSDNIATNDPFYHFQGMYKDQATKAMYISLSVGAGYLPQVYVLDEVEDKKQEKYKGRMVQGSKDTFEFQKDFKNYCHPGGIQSASNGSDNILAVGFEKYNDGGFGTKAESLISFFNINNPFDEYEHLRVIKDEVASKDLEGRDLPQNMGIGNDWASASGIVWLQKSSCFLTVSRGKKQALEFFVIDRYASKIKSFAKIEHVGEFQNVNLMTNELNEIYMVGFESTKGKLGTGKETNFAWMYKLDFEQVEQEAKIRVKPVWINEEGLITTTDSHIAGYDKKNKAIVFDKNRRQVTTQDGASFQWASCLYLAKPNKEDGEKPGFINKLTMYSVCSVPKKDKKTYDRYRKEYEARKAAYESNTPTKGLQQPYYTIKPNIIMEADYYPQSKTYLSKKHFNARLTKEGIKHFVRVTFNSFT